MTKQEAIQKAKEIEPLVDYSAIKEIGDTLAHYSCKDKVITGYQIGQNGCILYTYDGGVVGAKRDMLTK